MICVSCSDNILGAENECLDCVLELSIPELNIDSNDYYHLDYKMVNLTPQNLFHIRLNVNIHLNKVGILDKPN